MISALPISVMPGEQRIFQSKYAVDVTDEFIQLEAGYELAEPDPAVVTPEASANEVSKTKVFIVHGHDEAMKNDVARFLLTHELKPIVLHRQLNKGDTVIAKLEREAEDVGYAIVLLSPDDVGCTVKEFEKLKDERKMKLRARQNVILECGFFFARLRRENVCLLYREGVELPADMDGLVYEEYDGDIDKNAYKLLKELKDAGLEPVF